MQSMLVAYVNLEKVFNSVHLEALWDLLQLHVISARNFFLLTGLYSRVE